ncbi:MAG: MobV family relaxase [Gallionellaceae bacterium]
MINYAILRTKKLKNLGNIAGSAAHVARTLKDDPSNIDRTRSTHNKTLLGSSNPYQDCKALIPDHNRYGSVLAVEVLATASPDFFEDLSTDGLDDWAADTIQATQDFWGADNMASAVLHMDEATPHIHMHIVPLLHCDKTQKKTLNCKHYTGTRGKMRKMQTDYAAAMSIHHLSRGVEGSTATHQSCKKMAGRSKLVPKTKYRIIKTKKGFFSPAKAENVATSKSIEDLENQAAKVPLLETRNEGLKETCEVLLDQIAELEADIETIYHEVNEAKKLSIKTSSPFAWPPEMTKSAKSKDLRPKQDQEPNPEVKASSMGNISPAVPRASRCMTR